MTQLYVHELAGLKPDALATYLAALGIMRLLAQQKDPSARGFWRDEHIVLVTELDWEAIERFFLDEYSPTPILAPWNMESGFFSLKALDADAHASGATLSDPGASAEGENEDGPPDGGLVDDSGHEGDEGDDTDQAVGDPLLDRFARCSVQRFASFRRAIEIARAAIPSQLRGAEENARRACAEMTARSDAERGKHAEALKELANGESMVAEFNTEVEAKKAAIKGVPRGAPERMALDAARERLAQAKERLRALKKKANDLHAELKRSEKRAKADGDAKARIKAAKTSFGEIQKATKERLIVDVRVAWSVESREWLDAAMSLDQDGKAGFTSLFGSGGNDGRMEFTKNLRYHLNALFDLDTGAARPETAERFRSALFGHPTNRLVRKKVGQLFPGRAGGTNMGAGFSGDARVNPWEFVLMLEGAVALVSGISRRGEVDKAGASSPFWVAAASAGFGSASQLEDSPRGEQWLPLWSRPLRYDELVELVREGRAQVGRRQTARAGELARAAARLGLARGIDSLQRFAYLKRNGQSNLAVFTGRFRVASRSHQELLDDVAPWIGRLAWHANDNAPASLGVVARRAADLLFAVCGQDATAVLWRKLLTTLGEAELVLLRSGKSPVRRPLPRLSSGWLAAVDDGTPEGRTALRLAVALASQHSPREKDNQHRVGSVRRHFLPLDDADSERPRFKLDADGRVQRDLEHVCLGRDLVTDAIAVVRRRSLWARSSADKRKRFPRLPLEATTGCEASLDEIGAWVRGEVSDETVIALARPLLALDWSEIARGGSAVPRTGRGVPDPLQMLFRLAHLPFDVPVRAADGRREAEVPVRLDPEPVRRLAAGDLDGALRVTVRRLSASGLRPAFRRGVATAAFARRLAASLVFPILRDDAALAARLVCKPYDVKDLEQPSHTLLA